MEALQFLIVFGIISCVSAQNSTDATEMCEPINLENVLNQQALILDNGDNITLQCTCTHSSNIKLRFTFIESSLLANIDVDINSFILFCNDRIPFFSVKDQNEGASIEFYLEEVEKIKCVCPVVSEETIVYSVLGVLVFILSINIPMQLATIFSLLFRNCKKKIIRLPVFIDLYNYIKKLRSYRSNRISRQHIL